MTDVEYWKQRLALAEKCLEATPCDPDVNERQIEAWRAYHAFIEQHGDRDANPYAN